jgi:hypothetical protein
MRSHQEYLKHADALAQEVHAASCQLVAGTIKADFKLLIEKESLYQGSKRAADGYRDLTPLIGREVPGQASAVAEEAATREVFAKACKDYNEAHGGEVFSCLPRTTDAVE